MPSSKISPAVIESTRRPARSYVPPPLRQEAPRAEPSPVPTPRQAVPTQWPRPTAAPRSNIPPTRPSRQEAPAEPAPAAAPAPAAIPAQALPQGQPSRQSTSFVQQPRGIWASVPAGPAPQWQEREEEPGGLSHQQEAAPSAALPQGPGTAPEYLVVEEEGYGEKREVLGPVRRALVGNPAPADSWLATTQALARWVREAAPPRSLWAKGCGAWGQFVSAGDLGALTGAEFLGAVGRTTPALVRFSLMSGRPGSPDTQRDIRGMAVKLYTADGNLDLLTQSLPVFPISRGSLLPELARALGPDPRTGLGDRTRFWDFCARHPETLHALTYLYTVWGLGGSYRTMAAYSPFTHLLRGRDGHQWLCRFAWLPRLGYHPLPPAEAQALGWQDPDAAARDLQNHLAAGGQVLYDLAVQVMDPTVGEHLEFCPLDATALWPADRFPPRVVGTLTLTHNPQDHLAQVEQAAFAPGNLVPGVALSGDPLLDAAAFAMGDSHRHRLGLGGLEQPVNSSVISANPPSQGPDAPHPPGRALTQGDPYAQAGARFRAMDPGEQFLLAGNMAAELASCSTETVQLLLEQLYAACPQWAMTVWGILQGGPASVSGVG